MKQYIMITTETLERMVNSFTDEEEYSAFVVDLLGVCAEINFANEYMKRHQESTDLLGVAMAKAIVMFSSFARDNIEAIRGLVATVDFQTVTVEEPEEVFEEEDDDDN